MRPEEVLKNVMGAIGPAPAGLAEYLKSCEELRPLFPSDSPDVCLGYRTPEGEVLHQVMMSGYFEFKTMPARDDDVLVISYPKAGTTWTQEITYLVAHDADFVKAKSKILRERFPFIEMPFGGIKAITAWPERRLIKTHLPYELLPVQFLKNNTKIVYVTRNPKDTVVSYYFFVKMLAIFSCNCSMKEFVDLFVEEKNIMNTSFANNVLGFWNRRHQDNVLFLTYEGLAMDLKGGVKQIADFLGKFYDDDILDKITDHCSYDSMKNNPMIHGVNRVKRDDAETDFFRKGKVGDWKNYFDDEMNQKMDRYVAEKFKGSGLEFIYEL